MGIYTNFSNNRIMPSHYTEVEPFVGEHFNYHSLGIIAASEIAANHNSFMKSIALSELAALEQTGSTDVFYEAVNISGILEKIKMFFKKIIEKIHKIFHTFIARMSAWFGKTKDFARTYGKEIIKKWGDVSENWEFKGFEYTHLNIAKSNANSTCSLMIAAKKELQNFIKDGDIDGFIKEHVLKGSTTLDDTTAAKYNADHSLTGDDEKKAGDRVPTKYSGSGKDENDTPNGKITSNDVKEVREKLDDIREGIRGRIIKFIAEKDELPIEIDVQNVSGYDQTEFTEELFKVFRHDNDTKEMLSRSQMLSSYGGSITGLVKYLEDFDTIKNKTESAEKNIVKGINDLINKVDKAQNGKIKEAKAGTNTTDNELLVEFSSLIQSLYGSLSESLTQAFSALLTAQKDACTQAKEIAVKVIGQSKKVTKESYDYSEGYSSYDGGFDFINSVKLI